MSQRPRRWRAVRAVAKRIPYARRLYRAYLRRRSRSKPTAIVYVDGFNLYRNMLKYQPEHKWLDLSAMCRALLPGFRIKLIRYFTAEIRPLKGKDQRGPSRQKAYLRAVALDPLIRVHKGSFQSSTRWADVHPIQLREDGQAESVRVRKIEEKQSDVSLGAWMVLDATRHEADVLFLLSNDSDFAGLCELLSKELRQKFGLISPSTTMTKDLLKHGPAHVRKIRRGVLRDSQYPDELTDEVGTITRPDTWQKAGAPVA